MKEFVLQFEGSTPVKLLFCRLREVIMLRPEPQSGGRGPVSEQFCRLRLVRLLKAPYVPHDDGNVPA